MISGIGRAEARIQEIERLLGENAHGNGEFGAALTQAQSDLAQAGALASGAHAGHGGHGSHRSHASAAPASVAPLIQEAAAKTGVSPDLISAVIQQESGFHAHAVSSAGALGMMQLMPGTARSLGVKNPFDAEQNILGGAEYLRQQIQRFGSVEKALAAYNAGPKAVERYGGVPPIAETRNYVHSIMSRLRRASGASE